ncbi:hypothetical protein [Streptomyces sp. NPDC006638]|uniref:hypothetical protein n=1 Tax=Streptomyces sp. NPDC006638 TaxID=3157183 RepID=UPI0033A44A4C
MPIRPENLHRYPRDWNEISARIRFGRAGGRCECTGHCGLTHPGGRCPAVHEEIHPDTGSVVGLTTAHLNHTPEDVRETNLLAACQLCHLRIDHGHHRVTRSLTLAARAAAAGQLGLLPETALVRTEPPTPPRPTRGRAPAAVLHQLPFPEPDQEKKPMARISVKIAPLHPDGTECNHAVRPSGKPRDADSGCTGRRRYAVVCSTCGQVGEPHSLRVLAEPAQSEHRNSHKAMPTPATH